jgi:hypothetical protein
VREHFDLDTDVGRRRRALFPIVAIDAKRSKNKREIFTLYNGRKKNIHQEGNCKAYGVHSQAQGVTVHRLRCDDPSDEKEQAEEGTRERTNNALASTWMSRLTGQDAFFTYICTRWHPEDFCGVLLRLAKSGDMNLAYYSLACGGPEDGFAPIWPEAGYDEAFLKAVYARLGPVNYACQYQNNPDAEESRRVKKLICFDRAELDPETRSEEYTRFFNDPATTYYLSVDPTGTSSKYSHLAGITYAAMGNLRVDDTDYLRLLFMRFWSVHEGQLGLAQIIADFCKANKVDQILVETTSGFHATPEALEVVHGIPSTKVLKRAPGAGTKIARLLKYAIHLEAGDAQFPGVWIRDEHGDQVLQMDPDWVEMSTQLLQSGTARDDHLMDCVRQQLAEVSPDIYTRKYGQIVHRLKKVVSRKEEFFNRLMAAEKRKVERAKGQLFGPRNHRLESTDEHSPYSVPQL